MHWNKWDLKQSRTLEYSLSLDTLYIERCPAAKFLEWSVKNETDIVKAELASAEENDDETETQFDLAIAAAHSLKFVPEVVTAKDFKCTDFAASFERSHYSELQYLT